MNTLVRNIPRHIRRSARMGARHLVFWAGAVIVGLAALGMAVGSTYAHIFIHWVTSVSPLIPLAITPIGLALISLVTRKVFPGTQGSGIPQAMAALKVEDPKQRGTLLSLRIAVAKIGLTLFGLFIGGSIGREGPSVQVGSSIMYGLRGFLRASPAKLDKALILAGGAAGVAAAFNTPLAGVVFAIEEMSQSFEQKASGTVITAVIVAGIVTLAIHGDYSYFGHTAASMDLPSAWTAIPLCGVVGGLLGGLYSRILLEVSKGLPGKFGVFMKAKPTSYAFLCGIVLALIGMASGNNTYGTGYDEAKQLVEGFGGLPATFGLLKMLSSIVSYVSGIPGGIFAPSLAVGAGFGSNLAYFLPHTPAAAVIILGMVAYFTGVVRAPITAFVIVMEMTDNHAMVIPLMATALIADGVSKFICPKPFYKAMAQRFLDRFNSKNPEQEATAEKNTLTG